MSKLEAHEPEQIRWLLAEGHSGVEVARFFGISPATVCMIGKGKIHAKRPKPPSKALRYVGRTFNKLTIVSVVDFGKHVAVACECECGSKTVQRLDHVVGGRSKSCGCLKNCGIAPWNGTYYQTWHRLVADFSDCVCESWRESVENLWQDMGPRPRLHLLRRIDEMLPFEPGNCEWAPKTAPRLNETQLQRLTLASDESSFDEIVERFRVAVGYDTLGKSGIYQISNRVTGKVYIGSAVNIGARWRSHVNELLANKHHSAYLQRSWNKHGSAAFVFSVLEECDVSELIQHEQAAINELTAFWGWGHLYNVLRTAGSSLGHKHTDESRQRMSIAQRNKPPVSEETRQRIAAAHRGRKRPPEMGAKISAALKKHGSSIGHKSWATRRERYGANGRKAVR